MTKAKPKWVAKGSTKESDEAEQEPEEEVITSRLLLEPSTGPLYDKSQLLRLFTITKAHPDLLAKPKKAESTDVTNEADEDELIAGFTVKEREEEIILEGGRVSGMRRALKGQKKAKRLSTESLRDPDDDAAETPSGAQQIDLWQGLDSSSPMTPANAALMTYLQSMAVFAPWYNAMTYAQGQTTVMLRNIPNRYTRDMLIERLDNGYKAQYDFVYLPIDFNSKCNVGYAFINFRSSPVAVRFIQEFHGMMTKHCLPGFGSKKVCEVSFARVQGRDANMDNLRDDKFIEKLGERPEWQPLFYDDASKEISFSDILSSGSGKKRRPPVPPSPTGFMYPTPYGPAMYPYPSLPVSAASTTPPTTLASVLPSATTATTLMLRGIPSSLTREKVLELLNRSHRGSFDFLFLPGEVKTEGNRGFAFINFKDAEKAENFKKDFHEKKVSECFPGLDVEADKVLDIVSARMDSLEKSVERVQMFAIPKGEEPADDSTWLPILLDDEGEVKEFPTLTAASAAAAARGQARPAAPKATEGNEKDGEEGEAKAETKGKKGKGKGEKSQKGAGKGKGDGKGVGKNASAGYGYPAYSAYPGYPPAGTAAHAAFVAQMQHAAAVMRANAAVQAAHMQAYAAATHYASGGKKGGPDFASGLLDPLSAAVNPPRGKPLNKEQKENLRRQMEYYFSTQNLCKDLYLRTRMSTDGWVALDVFADFPKVRNYRTTVKEIAEATSTSSLLEVDREKRQVRLKDEVERRKWVQPAAEAASQPPAASDEAVTA